MHNRAVRHLVPHRGRLIAELIEPAERDRFLRLAEHLPELPTEELGALAVSVPPPLLRPGRPVRLRGGESAW